MYDIEIKGLKKSYKNKTIIDGIDLQIERGECFGLIGSSGVGKSTLLKIIMSQAKPDEGEVKVFGLNVEKENICWENIGIMGEGIACFDRLTPRENLELLCRIHGIGFERVTELLNMVGLDDEKKQVRSLSKGMKQRLLFAKSIINSPELLLLDEPTSDLDPVNKSFIQEIIKSENKKGTTVIVTTHDMEEASLLCDKVGIMYRGIFVEYGKFEDICDKHNLKPQIIVKDTNNKEYRINMDNESNNRLCELLKKIEIADIYIKKPNLEEIFREVNNER